MKNTIDETSIVVRLRNRDYTAMVDAMRFYYDTMFFMVNGIVNNREDAEDIVMKTFEDMYEKIDKYTPTHKLSTWLFTIAHNNSIDVIRKRERTIRGETDIANVILSNNTTPETDLIYEERMCIINNIISNISEEDKIILNLRNEGMSFDEIAQQIGKPSVSLRTRFHRLKNKLLDQINKI